MTVYVSGSVADRPRVRHLPNPDSDRFGLSLCLVRVQSADRYAERRAAYLANSWRESRAKPIDYEALPLCRLCEKASKP